MMRIQWCPLVERESGIAFLVSPRSGRLLAFPDSEHLFQPEQALLRRRERLYEETRVDVLISHDEEQGYIGNPDTAGLVFNRTMLRVGWLVAEVIARCAPLDTSFRVLDCIACFSPPRRTL